MCILRRGRRVMASNQAVGARLTPFHSRKAREKFKRRGRARHVRQGRPSQVGDQRRQQILALRQGDTGRSSARRVSDGVRAVRGLAGWGQD